MPVLTCGVENGNPPFYCLEGRPIQRLPRSECGRRHRASSHRARPAKPFDEMPIPVKTHEPWTKEKPVTSCDKPLEEVSAYLDNELGPEEMRAFQHHLDTCAACRDKVKLF